MKSIFKRYPILSAFIISGLISSVFFILVLLFTMQVLLYFFPSHIIRPDGSIERYQAFAQFFGSVIISAIVSLIAFIFGYIFMCKRFERLT